MPEGARRIMRDFSIFEISCVDRPAQKGAVATIIKSDDQSNKGGSDVSDKELQAQVASLTKELATATEASKDAKLAVGLQKQLDELKVKFDEVSAALGVETQKAKDAGAVAEMNDEERAYYSGLDKEQKATSLGLSAADRKKAMTKAASDDEVIVVEGRPVSKRKVGDDQFAIIKSQAENISKNEADIAKERTAR